ncbi:MAG: hypothetical protein ACUBOA_06545 [Candidatus Loosdrechtia sp.]|uniref:hypothetical protein n=1 Tax=Candidatus Loosdrechtia sp. TaxID=3101272 RepID=UPI003A7241F5|nr:MAG: hypothetical protein QY305_10490 [Candidatus Jettenia sp. AMX2]
MKPEILSRFALAFLFAVASGITSICYAKTSDDKPSAEEIKKETQELIQALKAYTAEQRDQAIEKTKAALESLDKRIQELEKTIDYNWDKMDKTVREKARDSLSALRKQQTQLADWYGNLKSSTSEAWSHMMKGFSDAFQAIHEAWEKSVKELSSDKK